ncbi:MAG: hypothetical protein JRH20_16165, partial [Deltaproteobacteria bacterium]|nr:hypothetical protein [Deltaproteobacteria bacterium]
FNLVAIEGLQRAQEKVNAWLASKSVSCSCGSCGSGTLMIKTITSRVDSYKLCCVGCGATTTPKAMLRSSSVTTVGTKTIGGVASDGDTVFLAQENSRIYRSRGGEKFKVAHKGRRPYNQVFVSSKGRVFASGYGEVIHSDDDGQSWTSVPCKPPLYLFQFTETPAGTIFVPTMGYVYRSKNGGRSFTRAKLPSARDVFHVVVASEETLFIVGNGGTLLRSVDGGTKWKKLKAPVRADLLRGLAFSEEAMLLVGRNGVALTTANGGKTWTRRRTGTTGDIEDMTLGNDGRIYAVTSKGEILISANDGKKWSIEPSGTSAYLYSIGTTADGTLLMGGAGGTVVEREGLDCPAEQKEGTKESHAKKSTTKKSTTKKSTTKKSATKKSATKKSATKKSATKKSATKKSATDGTRTTVGRAFLFTGKLASMSRAEAKSRVAELGGVAKSSVTKDLDYLVVGDDGSPLFGGGKKGSKIVAGEKLIAAGTSLRIISETDFLTLERAE